MAKGEIACFELFLFLSLFSKKPSAAEASENVYMRERINFHRPRLKYRNNLFAFDKDLTCEIVLSLSDHESRNYPPTRSNAVRNSP